MTRTSSSNGPLPALSFPHLVMQGRSAGGKPASSRTRTSSSFPRKPELSCVPTSSFPRPVTPQRSAGGRRESSAGFTLLELLIVLSIIAIATGLIVPNLAITDNAAFNADVRRAASALTYARRMAIVKGAPQSATLYALDPEARDYDELLAEANANDGNARWASDDIALEYQSELAPDAERVDKIDVTFFPQGGSTGGLLVFMRGERSALIRVNAITGRIETAYNGEELDDES